MDIPPLRVLSLFAGAGGLDLGARLVGGFRTVCWVEKDRYAQGVLMSRMRDGSLDDAPIWDDVCDFDGRPWRGRVDVVCGGFPCQDLSFAGKRAGIVDGKRSGLWREYARIVGEVGPRFVLVENVPGLLTDGALGVVLGDLADLGFDAEWWCLSAAAVGAPHLRKRIFLVAHARRERGQSGREAGDVAAPKDDFKTEVQERQRSGDAADDSGATLADAESFGRGEGRPEPDAGRQTGIVSDSGEMSDSARERCGEERQNRQRPAQRASGSGEVLADADQERRRGRPRMLGQGWRGKSKDGSEQGWNANRLGKKEVKQVLGWADGDTAGTSWWATEPHVGRVAHGVAFRMDRLRLCGNGVVPQQSVPAWALVKRIAAHI